MKLSIQNLRKDDQEIFLHEPVIVTEQTSDILFETNALIEVPLRGITFPDNIQIGYKYVKTYAYRDNTGIYAYYEDALNDTSLVEFKVYYNNGSLAYENNATTALWSDTWLASDNQTDYYCIITITHDTFGVMDYRQVLPHSFGGSPPFSLASLGTLPFDTAYIIPAFILRMVKTRFKSRKLVGLTDI